MSSDPKNYFGFLVDEYPSLGLLLTLNNSPVKYSLNEFRLNASFKPIESI